MDELLTAVRAFIDEQVLPLETTFLADGPDAVAPALAELRQTVKQAGWWVPFLPKHEGGMGLSLPEFARLSEELGRSLLGHYVFNCQAPDVGNMELLLAYGTAAQKEQFLAPLLAGEIRSCFAMTEPEHAGSNPVWMSTTAVEDGDHYVINGHKWFTSSADGASFTIVMAETNPDADKPYRRYSQILVPLDTPGFELVRNISVMGEAGSGYFSHAEVRFTDCRVPKANLLGGDGEGFVLAQQRLGPGRIHHCMRWIGICERALELMCRRAINRQLSPDKVLAEQQVVQHMIADCRAEIDASRFMVLDAAEQVDRLGSRGARVAISTIKFFVANTLQRVLDRAIQVHGALGMTDDTVLAYWFRHERGARIYDGPDEVHKTVLAREVLKDYGFRKK